MANRSERNSLNSTAELCGCLRPRQANFLSFIKSVRIFDAADAPGIAQEQFIEMVNKTDNGTKSSFSETQFSASKLLDYKPLANIFEN